MMDMSRTVQLHDLARFVSIMDPRLSPDSQSIAFVAVKGDEKRDDYDSTIWVIDRNSGAPKIYLGGGTDRWPRWSPDGKSLLFLSKRTMKEGERGNELWVASVLGGEPRLVLRLDGGIDAPQWMADGKRIAFLSTVGRSEEGVHAISRIPVWSNAAGFTYGLRKHLHIVDVNSGIVRQLTEGEMNVVYAAPSNVGDDLAYVAATDDLNPMMTDLYVMDSRKTSSRRLTEGNMNIGPLCWGPDDRYIAFRGHNMRRGFATHATMWLTSVEMGKPKDLTGRLDRGCALGYCSFDFSM